MKYFRFVLMFLVLTVFFTSHFAMAQLISKEMDYKNVKKVAQSGYQFLKIGIGAHTTGMGDVGVTNEGDASTVFWNPAGLATIEGKSVFVGYTDWFADMQQQAFSAAIGMGRYGVFAISAINMDSGDIMGTAISNNNIGYEDTGLLDVGEYAIGLTYARRFTDKFGLGITAKYCSQNLDAMSSNVIAFDIGTVYNPGWNNVKIAMSIQHFSRSITYVLESVEIPLTFRVGISSDLLGLAGYDSDKHEWNLVLEGVNPRDYSERVHLGTEYWFNNMVALRGGYKFNYDEESYTLGFGVKFLGLELDYSYADFGNYLSTINRFSAFINF